MSIKSARRLFKGSGRKSAKSAVIGFDALFFKIAKFYFISFSYCPIEAFISSTRLLIIPSLAALSVVKVAGLLSTSRQLR